MQNNLSHLAQVFGQITDPRSKHGTYPVTLPERFSVERVAI